MTILVTALLILLSFCGYVIFNLMRKVEMYEEIADTQDKYIKQLEHWYNYFNQKVSEQSTRLKAIDRNGAFSSDDEVGFVFKEIQQIIDELKKLAGDEENGETR